MRVSVVHGDASTSRLAFDPARGFVPGQGRGRGGEGRRAEDGDTPRVLGCDGLEAGEVDQVGGVVSGRIAGAPVEGLARALPGTGCR